MSSEGKFHSKSRKKAGKSDENDEVEILEGDCKSCSKDIKDLQLLVPLITDVLVQLLL